MIVHLRLNNWTLITTKDRKGIHKNGFKRPNRERWRVFSLLDFDSLSPLLIVSLAPLIPLDVASHWLSINTHIFLVTFIFFNYIGHSLESWFDLFWPLVRYGSFEISLVLSAPKLAFTPSQPS